MQCTVVEEQLDEALRHASRLLAVISAARWARGRHVLLRAVGDIRDESLHVARIAAAALDAIEIVETCEQGD